MYKSILSSRLLVAALTISLLSGVATATNAGVALAQSESPPVNASPTESTTSPEAVAPALTSSAAATTTVYAPIMRKNWPPDTLLGVGTANLVASASGIFDAKTTWVRLEPLMWNEVEPTQGARNWPAGLEDEIKQAAARNARVLLIIWGTPSWAQQIPGKTCSPIRSDKLGAFATFVKDTVARYSKPPFNVKHWEIWNEQDLPSSATPEAAYGCWGNPSDPYYGGGYYADVLKQVAPQIRAADPAAKIVLGGLLLACSPDRSASCISGKYLEGILRNGGGPHIDIVNFHAYDAFDVGANAVGRYTWPDFGAAWNTTGPSIIAKSRFVKKIMNQYGIGSKPVMNSEVALVCWACTVAPSNYNPTKDNYIVQSYAAAIAEGLIANIWFSWEGWYLSQLNGSAFTAYKLAGEKYGGATFAGEIAAGDVGGVSGVKGYKFNRDGKALWVIWSHDGATKNVTLPGVPKSIANAVGTTTPPAASIQITVNPLYIEWP
jgi:hypothetical protein